MNAEEIRSRIRNDAALRALIPSTAAIATALSTGRTRAGKVSREWFALWCAKNNLRSAIEDISTNKAHPLRSVALSVIDVLRGGAQFIDFALLEHRTMLANFVQSGAITQAHADELIEMATHPDPVDEMSVRMAMWAEDGRLLV